MGTIIKIISGWVLLGVIVGLVDGMSFSEYYRVTNEKLWLTLYPFFLMEYYRELVHFFPELAIKIPVKVVNMQQMTDMYISLMLYGPIISKYLLKVNAQPGVIECSEIIFNNHLKLTWYHIQTDNELKLLLTNPMYTLIMNDASDFVHLTISNTYDVLLNSSIKFENSGFSEEWAKALECEIAERFVKNEK